MNTNTDILIIGGGIAGLTCAIHLSRLKYNVVVIEKNNYPNHKVCGEYISNEVLPYLKWLAADPKILSPSLIDTFQFTSTSGKSIHSKLPLGGFGVSRYTFDDFLAKKARANGCIFINDTVTDVHFDGEFTVSTATKKYQAKIALGAYGKRSSLDHKLKRNFISKKSNWLAVKAHYAGDFPSNVVALHHFKGGYCGVSKVENDTINICYLANYESFKRYKDIDAHQKEVLYQNPALQSILTNSKCLFETPLTISQLSFGAKEQIHNELLMIGDTAGLIHPLCGNGMAMAINSARLCANLVQKYLEGSIESRTTLAKQYEKEWKAIFSGRLRAGKWLSNALTHERTTALMMGAVTRIPGLLPLLISSTHGKPLTEN
jgi:flavin-dependent dehydrogenase